MRTAGWVVALSCLAMAEQPEVWYPAQQAATSSSAQTQQPGQQPSTQPGTQPEEPAGPGTQAAPGTQSGQPGVPASNDPRVDQPLQPIEPVTSSAPPLEPSKAQETTAPQMLPDTTPLNTPQPLTLGTPTAAGGGGRNYFIPSLQFTQYTMVNSVPSGWETMPVSNLSGTAQLVHNWTRTNLTMNFTSGGSIYPTNSTFTSQFQQFGMLLGFNLGKWNLMVNDQASYLPESAFGYFGLGMGQVGTGINSQFTPDQSILTDATRLANTVSTTATYRLSAHSNLHFYGTYGIMRFSGGSALLVNSDNYSYSAGYDRTFGRNTLGLSYVGSMFTYGGSTYDIRTDGFNVAFGRRITGRLAWQIAGGPQVRTVSVPAQGSDTAASWNLNSGLTYQVGKMQLSATFARNTTAGAGILAGAETYEWMGGLTRPIGRQWSAGMNVGVARNISIQQATSFDFQTEFVTAQITRLVTKEASLFVSYNFQRQSSDYVVCLGCGNVFERHMFGVGFQWQSRPLAFNPF